MKKIQYNLLNFRVLVLIFFFLSGCKEKKYSKDVFFDKTIVLEENLESIQVSPDLLLEKDMLITSDHLITLGANQGAYFKVFDLQSLDLVGEFGNEGEGPEDFTMPFSSGMTVSGEQLVLGDLLSMRSADLNSDFWSEENQFSRTAYPSELIPLNFPFLLNPNTICGQVEMSSKHITCFDIKLSKLTEFIDYPDFISFNDEKPYERERMFQNQSRVSPDGSYIILTYSYIPLVRIFDVKSGGLKEVFIKNNRDFYSNNSGSNNQSALDNQLFYHNVKVSNKFIYAFYQEEIIEDDPQSEGGLTSRSLSDKELHVIDFAGNAIKKIKLPDWAKVFSPSLDDKFLYFLHPEIEDQIFKFPLEE
ncbi:BF3164 family lipoprotein [Belliella pelovolcani]|uniref:BF3164 family lipoprotein n=1 Tax=Belliella pelovolcani TaxID=529505 RepID=UPI00391C40B1